MEESTKKELAKLVVETLKDEFRNIFSDFDRKFSEENIVAGIIEKKINENINKRVENIFYGINHPRDFLNCNASFFLVQAIKDRLATIDDEEFKKIVYRALLDLKS